MAVTDGDTSRPKAWVFAEYNPEGRNTPEENAEGIIATLRALGLDYWDVDEWVGDQPARDRSWVVRKSNKELRSELARAINIPGITTVYSPSSASLDNPVNVTAGNNADTNFGAGSIRYRIRGDAHAKILYVDGHVAVVKQGELKNRNIWAD